MLQKMMIDLTHHAIGKSAAKYKVHSDSFYMEFIQSDSDPLSIEQDLCAYKEPDSHILATVIEKKGDVISGHIKVKLMDLYPNEDEEMVTVSISISTLSELSLFW